MAQPILSAHGPVSCPPELLEELCVLDKKTVKRLAAAGAEDVRSGSRRYSLIIGPAGAGKSHLLAVLRKRLSAGRGTARRTAPVTLPHETWGITTCAELLARVTLSLEGSAGVGEAGPPVLEEVLPRLREVAAGRVVVLFIENLSGLFAGLGEEEQLRLRAFLQQEKLCSIFAAAREAFPAVARREAPFFGFFRVEHLAEPDRDGAFRLVAGLLEAAGRPELAADLEKMGRPGLRAFVELLGARPRHLVHLARCLAEGGAGDPVAAIPAVLDRMTPALLAGTDRLSRQQRQLVECLVRARRALRVKEIAVRCGMSEQTASGQLRNLKEEGLAAVHRQGRNSFYELADPLLRNCLEMRWSGSCELARAASILRRRYLGGEIPAADVVDTLGGGSVKKVAQARSHRADLPGLALALILARGRLLDPLVSEAAVQAWLERWREVGGGGEVELALRLTEYTFRRERLADPSATAFLLPEERRMLELLPAGKSR